MTFNWVEYLLLAKGLETDPGTPGPCEAALRSAASRAYYAAYHCALDFACREGFEPYESGEDHRGVQKYFLDTIQRNKVRGRVAKELGRLLKRRNDADYQGILQGRPADLAKFAVEVAIGVLQDLDSL